MARLGTTLAVLGRHAAADRMLRACLELIGDDPAMPTQRATILVTLGHIQRLQGDLAGALGVCEEARHEVRDVGRCASGAAVCFLRASLALDRGDWDEAHDDALLRAQGQESPSRSR